MDGSGVFSSKQRKSKGKTNRKQKYKVWLKRQGLNEHHRKPRSRQGGRGHGDLNIVKVGIEVHRCFHHIFGVEVPTEVTSRINVTFAQESEYLVVVPTKFFSTFHRYFTNREVLELKGMARYGLTWGHLFLYGTPDDVWNTFRSGRHFVSKPDYTGDVSNRWQYLFSTLTLSTIAYELTRYWLPLDCVVIAIPKAHRDEVDSFLRNLAVNKRCP